MTNQVRGGFGSASVGGGGVNVGRGNVVAATNARQASAGKNYFGRSTGYAETKLDRTLTLTRTRTRTLKLTPTPTLNPDPNPDPDPDQVCRDQARWHRVGAGALAPP